MREQCLPDDALEPGRSQHSDVRKRGLGDGCRGRKLMDGDASEFVCDRDRDRRRRRRGEKAACFGVVEMKAPCVPLGGDFP